jgi:hypothetical protein
MSNLINLSSEPTRQTLSCRHEAHNFKGWTTSDFRRLLSDLQQRPRSHRAFLRKLLRRAAASSMPIGFPVANHADRDPVELT